MYDTRHTALVPIWPWCLLISLSEILHYKLL